MAFRVKATTSALCGALIFANNRSNISSACSFFFRRLPCRFSTLPLPSSEYTFLKIANFNNPSPRLFCSSEANPAKKKVDTKVNFSLSDSEGENEDDSEDAQKEANKNKKLPPPYDPFNKKPAIEEPKDPKDLQEIFHNMRSGDGLLNHAVKMFDALSKDGLTHEALELFGQIKDKGQMPDVVAHTAIIEAYANAGQPKEALKVYMRMLASGVSPNAYTYTVLIKGLASDSKFLGDAKKYMLEMMEKGMKPNAVTYTAVFEALARDDKAEEATHFLEQMKTKGFVADEKAVREVLSSKRGPIFRTVLSILFGR
ncbi:pentatricopeptide repeat-containing protein At4g38150-like [Neltuma alba]|uniref:pentatricopeptide repeat-containing protein At4g38150-like n=1 Tax=Neltuma alba TaxID=207710 RepID=UPI0010A4F3DA|nr:pentatricopeptide repeat-containing protein At4g38150-like [Prosopis alba]